MALKHQLKE